MDGGLKWTAEWDELTQHFHPVLRDQYGNELGQLNVGHEMKAECEAWMCVEIPCIAIDCEEW